DLVAVYNASRLVVGYPRNMDGSAGEQAQYVERFVESLRAATALPIELVDERLTTRQAHKAMLELNVKAKRRKELVDQQAAALILQTFLDREARAAREAEQSARNEE
ncbi:MAG: Holliday junction resolvase RuvX, partial [Candidatus Sericytochromatia bacterium]|nr:Holliday junction resolvase RuvX [Candidatus Sericytochromatia bacterium]